MDDLDNAITLHQGFILIKLLGFRETYWHSGLVISIPLGGGYHMGPLHNNVHGAAAHVRILWLLMD